MEDWPCSMHSRSLTSTRRSSETLTTAILILQTFVVMPHHCLSALGDPHLLPRRVYAPPQHQP